MHDEISLTEAAEWLGSRCSQDVSVSIVESGQTRSEHTGKLQAIPDAAGYRIGAALLELSDPKSSDKYLLRYEEAERDCLVIQKGGSVEIQIWSADRAPRVWNLNEIAAELLGRALGDTESGDS